MKEEWIGEIATCRAGRRGLIETYDENSGIYHGTGIDDGQPWQSVDPALLDEDGLLDIEWEVAEPVEFDPYG